MRKIIPLVLILAIIGCSSSPPKSGIQTKTDIACSASIDTKCETKGTSSENENKPKEDNGITHNVIEPVVMAAVLVVALPVLLVGAMVICPFSGGKNNSFC